MRLDIASYQVTELDFGPKTELAGGALVVDKGELRGLVLEDPAFRDVQIDLARPGESVRMVHVLDAIQPRWKAEGPGTVFPGLLGSPDTVGQGVTNGLSGMAVVTTGDGVPGEPVHWREGIIDMGGPGAPYSPFSRLLNITLDLKPNLDLFPPEDSSQETMWGTPQVLAYQRSLSIAGCKAAAHLARVTTAGKSPGGVETFELGASDPSLPKVVCIYQSSRPRLYGELFQQIHAGTMIHPNESFDGALTVGVGTATTAQPTFYLHQNNEVLMDLCRRHGRELNFVGYVLFGGNTSTPVAKERVSAAVSNFARLLGAEAVLVMGDSDSNLSLDCMLTLQKCEQMGIRTTLLFKEVGRGAEDPGFISFVPEADAIVNVGSREQEVTLPPTETVIGGERLFHQDVDTAGEITTNLRYIVGANNLLGMNHLVTVLE